MDEREKDALYYHGRTKTYTELHTHSNYKFRPLPWTPLSGCLPGLLCCDLSETLHFIIQHIQSAEFLTHDPYLSYYQAKINKTEHLHHSNNFFIIKLSSMNFIKVPMSFKTSNEK